MHSYTYNHANRLTQVVSGTLTTQYAYNGDGVRISKTVDGLATQYLVDLVATLPVVISDTEAIYLYGLNIIAQQQAQRYHYVHDGLGSVRQLTTSAGDIAETYAYDPFGVPLQGDAVHNPFRFTGEAWDAEVELLYLRARYYQPATGRFVSRDPWSGDRERPGALNLYVYVANNPVNHRDPSGLQPPYDPRESLEQATRLVRNWFYEEGDAVQFFGPEDSLTQDVRYSPSLARFREAWRERARQHRGEYPLPFSWTKDSIDVREGPPLIWRFYWAVVAYEREHIELAACVLGFGSRTAQGRIDPVGAVCGSFNSISAYDAHNGLVKIVAYNRMGWASAFRIPGTRIHPPNRPRSAWGPGGTVHQIFYWWELKPARVGPASVYTF